MSSGKAKGMNGRKPGERERVRGVKERSNAERVYERERELCVLVAVGKDVVAVSQSAGLNARLAKRCV
jgi:hypothetical protein